MEFQGDRGGRWSYDPSKPLGPAGGYGRPYEGTAEDGSSVAVKVIELGEGMAARLRGREREIADKLQGVEAALLIHVFDTAVVGNDLLLVMERADKNLSEHLRTSWPLSEDEATDILKDVVGGLRELHQASVIHRDLKPGNILLHEGRWKLADFGIARDVEVGTQTVTFIGLGTPPYMAPEIWAGRSPSFRSDLYAVGCIAFELLGGQPPFRGPREEDFRHQHAEVESPDPPTDDPVLKRMVTRLLSKDPASRHQDARAVEEALARVGGGTTGGRLASLAAQHAAEQSRLDTEKATLEVKATRVDELLRQSEADLEDCLIQGLEVIRVEIPEVEYEWSGNFPKIWTNDATISLHPQPFDFGADDTAIAFGSVRATNRRGADATIANIVYEKADDDRYTWTLYRFRANGALRDYPYGPTEQEHGLSENDFAKERGNMRSNLTHIFATRTERLTPEVVADLFGVALGLDGAWHS